MPVDEKQPVRDALWSVYYHSLFGVPTDACDKEIRPVPLASAVQTLAADQDEHDVSRKLRTLSLLATAGYARKNGPLRDVDPDVAQKIRASLMEMAAPLGFEPGSFENAFQGATATSYFAVTSTPACRIESANVVCCLDGRTLSTTATAKVRIERTPEQLRLVVDPQNWDDSKCSDVFVQAYVALPGSTSGTPVADPKPPDPGTSWRRQLYESVVVGPTRIDNLLGIDSRVTTDAGGQATAIRIDYWLDGSIRTVIGNTSGSGKLNTNTGYVEVSPVAARSGWSDLTMVKTVRFTNDVYNKVAPAMLFMWLDDASQIVACC